MLLGIKNSFSLTLAKLNVLDFEWHSFYICFVTQSDTKQEWHSFYNNFGAIEHKIYI